VLDKFRFEVPPEWVEPFTLEPSMPYEVRDVPGQRRHLVVRPTRPVSDRFRVRVRGGLALREDERVRMPDVMPLDVTSTERFVVLPTQLDRQRIDWETSGLQPVALRDVLPDGATDTAWTAFGVWSKPRAVISDVQRVAGVRQIRLADVQVACQADGRTQGLVVFDIEPAGADGCTLDVPPGLELIGTTVEGVPAMVQSAAEGKRHIQLASQQLPQRLTVLFRGNQMRPLVNSTSVLRVPWVNDFEVVRTLWTVRGPAGSVLRSEQANRHGVGPLRQEFLRLHHTASLIESTADTVLESPPQEVRDWYTPWAIRLAAADARIARDRWLPNPDTSAADWTAIQALRERQTSIAQRLKVTSVLDQVRTEPSVAPQPADLWALVPPAGCRILRFAFLGKVPALSVACEVPRESRGRPDFAAAAVVVLCGGLFWGFLRRTHLTTWLRQWPSAAGVLAGLAWWMWANPSVLGWLMVIVSLWGSLRFPFPSHGARDSTPHSRGERPR
jgi:hypothetical protein